MSEIQKSFDDLNESLDKLKNYLKKTKTKQVRGQDEKAISKANGTSWFNFHRSKVNQVIGEDSLKRCDTLFNDLISISDKQGARTTYFTIISEIKKELNALRKDNIVKISTYTQKNVSTPAPDFSKIITDLEMQEILKKRWIECEKCIIAEAPLAATVMIGGLIETVLLARINMHDQSKVFTSKSAPKDKAGKTLQLKEWTLKNYIEVAYDLGIISQTGKDVGVILRDYRNFIHPYKEKSHGIKIIGADAELMWDLCIKITRQLIK
jgi:hypothetical protein